MAQYAASSERAQPMGTAVTNPVPLGLSALGLTTFVFGISNARLFTGITIVIGLALFYGGLVQLLAGMREFHTGNTLAATAFCSYGGFWLAYGTMLQLRLIPTLSSLGFFYLAWALFTAILLVASLRTNLALMAVFLFLLLTFLALMIGAFASSPGFTILGGWLAIITGLIAMYTALASLLASVGSPYVLPTWPVRETPLRHMA